VPPPWQELLFAVARPCWLSGTASSTHSPCLSPQQEQVRELTAWSYKHSVHTSQPHTYSYLRADFRQSLVEAAEVASDYFRTTWRPVNRPRVTNSFRSACTWIRAPFVVAESLPQARDVSQVHSSCPLSHSLLTAHSPSRRSHHCAPKRDRCV
jgi:hypothetical protein